MNTKHIKHNSVIALIDTIKSVNYTDIQYVKQLYNQDYIYFNETMEFLMILGLISINHGKLVAADNATEEGLREAFILKIDIFENVLSFLMKFKLHNGFLSLKPTLNEIVKFESERNLLLDLKIAELHDGTIIITDNDLIKTYKNPLLPLEKFKERLQNNEYLGKLAESFVLQLEIHEQMLYQNVVCADNIKYISPLNVSAGYDIESFDKSAAQKGKYRKIYIEVKAVNTTDFHFYWSNNEVCQAKKYQDQYYLYLVSNITDTFENTKLIIIKNPYINVYQNDSWSKEIESYSFRRRSGNNE